MRTITPLVAGLLSLLAACQPGGGAASTTSNAAADLAGVAKVRDDFMAKWKAADVAGVTALYTADAQIHPEFSQTASGSDAISGYNKGFFDQWAPVSLVLTATKTETVGDLAYDRGTYRLVAAPKAKGDTLRAEGRYLVVLRKQTDGSWKLVEDIDNTSTPPAPPPTPAKKGK